MTMATKNNIFKEKLQEYLKGNKQDKSELLNAVCEVTGMVRKSAIRRFRKLQLKSFDKQECRGRPVMYTPDVIAALHSVWELGHEPCGENLHPMIGVYIDALEQSGKWSHTDLATGKLCGMSLGSVKRLIAPFVRIKHFIRGRGTAVPSAIHTEIPIRMDGWDVAPPGTYQVDTVAHCGTSTAGDFVYTVNMIDVATLFGCRRSQWNKGQSGTLASIDHMIKESPFSVHELHPDSGGEFVNWNAVEYCKENSITLTRSRPYHKNDNCFIEERNGHVVRKYLKYERFDVKELVPIINALYDVLTPYLNHFVASRRIIKKERIGARWKITREKVAKTPYQRVLERDDISLDIKERLQEVYRNLKVVILYTEIDKRTKKIFTVLRQHENKTSPRGIGDVYL